MSDHATDTPTSKWVWVVLLITVLLTAWTAMQDENTDEIVSTDKRPLKRQTKRSEMSITNESTGRWDRLDRTPNPAPKDLFAAANWAGKPKKMMKAKNTPKPILPKAPPIPFSYMGRMDHGPSGDVIYLADQEKSYSVKLGSKVGPFWRLDKEEKDTLHFTFLPLDLPKSLSKGQNDNAGFK